MRFWRLNSAYEFREVSLSDGIWVTEKLKGTTWAQNPASSGSTWPHLRGNIAPVLELITEQKYEANLCSLETRRS